MAMIQTREVLAAGQTRLSFFTKPLTALDLQTGKQLTGFSVEKASWQIDGGSAEDRYYLWENGLFYWNFMQTCVLFSALSQQALPFNAWGINTLWGSCQFSSPVVLPETARMIELVVEKPPATPIDVRLTLIGVPRK